MFLRREDVTADVVAKQKELVAAQMKAQEDDAVAELAAWEQRMQSEPDNVTDAVREKQAELAKKAKSMTSRPPQAKEKIAEGMLNKWFTDVVLLEQVSVKESKKSVAQVIAELSKSAKVTHFVRFEVGDGIDKGETKDFAAEVAEMTAKAAKG
jgi:elongation factor Ts